MALSKAPGAWVAGPAVRRAAVAVILRDAADGFAEALVLVRSKSERDRWSGHVCMPGGKVEPGEGLLQAAVREACEETGVVFSLGGGGGTTALDVLGRLDDRVVGGPFAGCAGRRAPMVVTAFVLALRESAAPVRLKPHAGEIDAACWVPLGCLLHGLPADTVPMPAYGGDCPAVRLASSSPVSLAPGVPDTAGLLSEWVPAGGAGEDEGGEGGEPVLGERWRLWGLTLGILDDMAIAMGVSASRRDWPPIRGRGLAGSALTTPVVAAAEAAVALSAACGGAPVRGRQSHAGAVALGAVVAALGAGAWAAASRL